MKTGNANYGGAYKKKNYFKLKDGDNVYRILPPLGNLADEGRWSMFWNVHYGYKNSKDQLRPFQSPLVKNRKTKMIEVSDPALERIEKLKAQFEQAKKDGNTELVAKLDKFVGQKGQYNLDNNHYMNVIDPQGNIGVLKIRHRAKVALDAEIKRLVAEGTDPLSVDNGRFFNIRRSGMGLDTTFTPSVVKKKVNINGKMYEEDVVHQLTSDILARLGSEAVELDKLFRRPTSEQVARFVKEGAKAVDEILDAKENASAPNDSDQDQPDADYQEPLVGAGAAIAAKTESAPIQEPAKAAPVVVTPVTTPVAAKSTPAPKPAATEQSDADFLASLM